MDSLPIEILLHIAQDSPSVWFRLVQTCRHISRHDTYGSIVETLQEKWTIITVNYNNYLYRTYKLPSGQPHRSGDKPACIYTDGSAVWYKYGEKHRDNGQPAVVWNNCEIDFLVNDSFTIEYNNGILEFICESQVKGNGNIFECEWWENGNQIIRNNVM
jgi:hypothetical protein